MSKLSSHNLTAFATFYFLLQGIGGLIPWTGVLSTLDFYRARYPTGRVDFVFPIAVLISSLIINFLMVSIKARYSINARIAYSNLICLVLILLMPTVAIIFPQSFLGYWIILFTLFGIGAINTVTCASLVGFAGFFPSQCMTDYNTGSGIGGIIPCLIRILIMLMWPDTSKQTDYKGILMYYGVSAFFTIFCVVVHLKFIKSKYAREQLLAFGEEVPGSLEVEEKESTNKINEQDNLQLVLESPLNESEIEDLRANSEKVKTYGHFQEFIDTFNETWLIQLLVMTSLAITYTLFPGVMLMNPMENMNQAWKIVLLELVFNTCDTIGKLITIKNSMVCGEKVICVLMLVRAMFFVTYSIEAITIGFPIIGENWFAFLNTALFGLTGGYAQGVLFILGPQSVEGKRKETVGFLLLTGYNVGVLMGSAFGLLFSYLE